LDLLGTSYGRPKVSMFCERWKTDWETYSYGRRLAGIMGGAPGSDMGTRSYMEGAVQTLLATSHFGREIV